MRAAALLEAPEVFHMQQVCCARDRDRPRFVHDRETLAAMPYRIFLAEANAIGYTATGAHSDRNELYRGTAGGRLDADQTDTILGEYQRARSNPDQYAGRRSPDCMMVDAAEVWGAQPSRSTHACRLFMKSHDIGE
jgi:hypothetical protein